MRFILGTIASWGCAIIVIAIFCAIVASLFVGFWIVAAIIVIVLVIVYSLEYVFKIFKL